MSNTQEFSRLENLIKGQSEVLELITQGKPTETILDKLINWAENQFGEGVFATIFRPDKAGQHLYHYAGNRLPVDFSEAINGLSIAANAASCGTAASTRKEVIVENINDSLLWKDFRSIAVKHSLHSCWSTPLINHEGILRGTLAFYYNEPKKPTEEDRRLITLVSHTALLAIEHQFAKEQMLATIQRQNDITESIRTSEKRFENFIREAPVGIIVLRGEDMIVDVVNDMYGNLIGRTPDELLNKPLFTIIPETEATFRPIVDGVRLSGEPLYLYHQPYNVVARGKNIHGYLNIVYKPYRQLDGNVSGVMVLCQDVTEMVRSRKKLEQSEQQFRNLMMKAPVAIAVFKGKDLIAEVVNDKYLLLVDRSREEFENKSLLETLPEVKDLAKSLAENFYAAGDPITFNEFPVTLYRNGKLEDCFFNAIWEPLYDLDGKPEGFIAVAQEITQQVQARIKAEESERQVQSLIESAPFPIAVYIGREMQIQFANQSIKDVWGKGSDVEGKTFSDLLPELAGQNIYEQLDRVYTTGIPFHAKHQRVDLMVDGRLQPFYFNYSFTPLFNTKGEVYGVMNTAAEVTELITASRDLEESEARARLAIQASEQGTFDVDLKTNYLKGSKRLAEIFDVEYDADRERYITAIHPDDLRLRKDAYKKAYQTSILEYDARVIKKKGNIIWVRVKGKIYFNENGEPERLVGIVQDITESKNFSEALTRKVQERTEALEHANKQLQSINDELQQFAYISSHDLQEPLRKIRIFSDIVSKSLEKKGEVNVQLQKIDAAAERMSGLIQSLLGYSRVTNATVPLEKIDLNVLFKAILTDYELLIEQKNAIIETGVLPTIEAVPLQMNQLFFNLIGNALKFTRRGTPCFIKVSASLLSEESKKGLPELKQGKDYTAITVQDNGIGFEQAFASKIFTVFQQLNERTSFGGYGIGLALCKKVVQAHGGLIFAEGETMKGAKFTVVLPLTQ